ncbi:MAG: hypothetical protein CMM52_14245 [Rhodospirillaceae bacterium]|nr:hypothetical protein [Rhodospirillaceae bacterium]
MDDAEKLIAGALKSSPDDPIYLYNYGYVLSQMKRWQDAADAYGRAAKGSPDNPDIAYNLALTLKRLGDLGKAENEYRQVISLSPNHAHAMADLSGILEKKGDLEEAIDLQERANELQPNIANFHFNLGVLKLKQHKWDAALEIFEKALSLEKWHVPTLAVKSVAHYEMGDDNAALRIADPSTKLSVSKLPLPSGVDGTVLIDAMVNHPTCQWERGGTSTKDGAQTGNLIEDTNPHIKSFVASLTEKIEAFIEAQQIDPNDPFRAQIPKTWNYSIWATILKRDGHQIPHLHPSAWLSGVYYLEVPPGVMDEANTEQQGWIEFGSPGYGIEPIRPPITRRIKPEPEKLIFFPSYFFHQTVPLAGDSRRISIAFDVIPQSWR